MALLELAALDRAGEKVGDGGEERFVLRAEVRAGRGRADAQDAVSAPVTAGDRDVDAADASMILQIGATSKRVSAAKSSVTTGGCGIQRIAG